jgi:hypothetical protein
MGPEQRAPLSRWALSGLLLAGLGACKPEDPKDSGTDLEPSIVGSIFPERSDVPANVAIYKAFGFDQNQRMLSYFSSSPNATCENVADYLRVGAEPYDPEEMFAPDSCNFFIRVDQDYAGGINYTRSADDTSIDLIGTGTSIECALGEGSFELGVLREGDPDEDYYYSGRWWVGHPLTYTYNFSGGSEEPYTFEISYTALDGGYTQESLDGAAATAEVTGTIQGEWCPELASTGLF